jgi:predicted small integral membrane protein
MKDNIRIDLREIVYMDMDWIHMAQERDHWWALVNTVMSLLVP